MMIPRKPTDPMILPDDVRDAYSQLAEDCLAKNIVSRIWDRDHTVWREDPTELWNRLGWLDLPTDTLAGLPEMKLRVEKLLERKPTDIVLLGMGGSSLCPEVFRRTSAPRPGFPKLHVLDSTYPDWVRQVRDSIQLESTLFLVASKSGGTIEVMSAFKYFLEQLKPVTSNPGDHFVAITDPGTGLAQLASEHGFAEVFVNNPNVGGRYSALSWFGMIPALLIGLDAESILRSANQEAHVSRNPDPVSNPAAAWGLFMAACAKVGRDKLTLVLSPAYESLGLWIEQLIAESTGKEGKGVLPIATEPLERVASYGSDRCFFVLADPSAPNHSGRLDPMRAAGHPVIEDTLSGVEDLGRQFFRWEFATAVASHFLDVQPFDQPNVQEAKTLTGEVLNQVKSTGSLPEEPQGQDLNKLLAQSKAGDYLAITAYLLESPELESALGELRTRVMRTHGLATTSGYGPRFLHSTGQFHKGGPNSGIFLQLVSETENIDIPDEPYGFSILCESQSRGDFKALESKGRRVARIRVGKNAAADIRNLAAAIG